MLHGLNHLRTQVVYFGRAIPWIIIDAIPYFRKWKLQPVRFFLAAGRAFESDVGRFAHWISRQNKVPTSKEQWECTKLVLLSHFTIELPGVCSLREILSPIH